MSCLKDACYTLVDAFTDMSGSDAKRREAYMELIASILSFLIAVVIISFVGKWLWNNIIVDLFTFAKPVRNIWQILGLMIFLALIK